APRHQAQTHRRHPAAADTGHVQAQEGLLREASAAGRQDPVGARVARGSGQTHRDVGLDRAGHEGARGRRRADARARLTHVSGRAEVAVVAGAGDGRVRAARAGVARIVGAGIAVVAAEAAVAGAGSIRAGVAGGAVVVVVAGGGGGGVHAPRVGPAGVVGAEVAVVATPWRSDTPPARAGVAGRARVEVVTRRGVRRMHAPGQRVAGVVRARVPVVAAARGAASAPAARTGGAGRAAVEVGARRRVRRVHAARRRVAR